MLKEILPLQIGGAFKSSTCDVNFYVTNQAGFNYVSVCDGIYRSVGTLLPVIVNWLVNTNETLLDLKYGLVVERLTTYDFLPEHKKTIEVEVVYGSIHHRDER